MSRFISRDQLRSRLQGQRNFLLFETLPREKYVSGHLPGAVNLPPDHVRDLAPQLAPDRNTEIVVYCGGPT